MQERKRRIFVPGDFFDPWPECKRALIEQGWQDGFTIFTRRLQRRSRQRRGVRLILGAEPSVILIASSRRLAAVHVSWDER